MSRPYRKAAVIAIVTTVVVTHDMRSARRLGQRIMMLHDRKIYASGTADDTSDDARRATTSGGLA